MKLYFKISLIIMLLALVIAIVAVLSWKGFDTFLFAFGLCCCLGGAFCFLAAFILWVGAHKERAKAFLFSAGITLLIGTGACSSIGLLS